MKRFAILLAATALASCSSEPAPEPTPEATETVAASTAASPTMADAAGNYEYTLPDGTKGSSAMTPEGTYTDTEGDKVETGAWTMADGKTCFDPSGDDPKQPTRCYVTTEPDANGVFTATRDVDGVALTVKKVS